MIGRRSAEAPPRPRAAWHTATVAAATAETPSARRLVLDVPTWPGNLAGQHVDVRLTADDGYQATRSYSLASSGADPRVELVVADVVVGEHHDRQELERGHVLAVGGRMDGDPLVELGEALLHHVAP